jgi:type IV secretory pathway TrbD component
VVNSALSPDSHSYTSSGGTTYGPANSAGSAGVAATPGVANSSSQKSSQSIGQYLVKSLSVSMTMPDTRVAASDLQSWITTTDPKAQSAGATYSLDNGQYDVTLTFSVEASLYPQVERYLANYAGGHKGKLLNLQESVQDVTNDYVDTQSQLANLRVEQARLQSLMSQAKSLTDVLAIDQRLTDVEGQIEQIEAHLNQLTGQTTYYTVQIQLLPLASYTPPVTQSWSPAAIFHDALASARAFGEGLLTLLIWLAVYAIYIVPLGVVIWLVVRYMRRRSAREATSNVGSGGAPPAA